MRTLHRPANLEDLFLKLTGRQIRDDAVACDAMLIPLYAAPHVSLRFWPVLLRNWLVWRKLAVPSMIGNIAEPLITLVAFGYGLGALVGQVQGLPYIEFLASGSVAVSAALAATFEALYSAYSRMQVQKTWDSIMNAPVALDDIVFAEMLWAALKALFSVSAIVVVIFLLGISRAADDAAGAAGAGLRRDHVRLDRAGLQRAGARATTSSPTTSRW